MLTSKISVCEVSENSAENKETNVSYSEKRTALLLKWIKHNKDHEAKLSQMQTEYEDALRRLSNLRNESNSSDNLEEIQSTAERSRECKYGDIFFNE